MCFMGFYEDITKSMHIKYQFYNVNQILAHRKNKKQNKQKISHPKPTPLCSCLGEGKRMSMKVGLKNSGGESMGDCSCTLLETDLQRPAATQYETAGREFLCSEFPTLKAPKCFILPLLQFFTPLSPTQNLSWRFSYLPH